MGTDAVCPVTSGSSSALILPERFGFRSGKRGTHGSRSIMLADLRRLLGSTPAVASAEDYKASIIEENVLGKSTSSTRHFTWKKLRELYGLNPQLAVFRCFRHFWEMDMEGRPLLAVLCACARDPLLRMGAPVVLRAPIDSVITPDDFAKVIEESAPDRFSPINLEAIGSRMSSSWLQSGHLSGGKVRKRSHPRVSPESTAYALLLGRLAGARGPLLFSTFWTAVLDAPMEILYDLTSEASRRGRLDFRRAGSVVDVGLSKLLTQDEEEALRESH